MALWQSLKDIAISGSRIVLPKQLEEAIGIPEKVVDEDEEFSKQSRTNQVRFATDNLKNTYKTDPNLLKTQIKNIIRQEIKSGNTNSASIKNAVKSTLKQQFNEQILSKVTPKEPSSVSGFIRNAGRNASEIVEGIGAIMGLAIDKGFDAVINPVDTVKDFSDTTTKLITSPQYREEIRQKYINPIVDEYKEYRNPLTKLYEDPIDVILDITGIASLGAKATITGGRIAARGSTIAGVTGRELAQARNVLRTSSIPSEINKASRVVRRVEQAKRAGQVATQPVLSRSLIRTGETLTSASRILSLKTLSRTTKNLVRKLPGGIEIVRNIERASQTRKLLADEQVSFINARNRVINKIDETVKKLTDEEVSILPRVVEGFVKPPVDASKAFYEAVGLLRSLSKESGRFGIKTGVLTPDVLERRRFQPIANWLEKERKFDFTDDTRVARETLDSDIGALNRERTMLQQKIEKKQILDGTTDKNAQKRLKTIEKEISQKERNFENLLIEKGFSSLTGEELVAQIEKIKELFPDADPIYMRHFFADTARSFSDFFINTKPVRTYKPGSTKRSYNRDGYVGQSTDITRAQLQEVLEKQALETMKWKANTNLVNKLISDPETKPLRPGQELLPGYTAFTPDGLLRFYKGTIDVASELQRRIGDAGDDVWDTFKDAVDSAFPKQRNYIGVTKAKMYQVPTAKAAQMQKLVQSANPYIKLFYDKPLDAFRAAALSLYPRWHFNNIVGNAIFSIISGDVLNPKAFYIYLQNRHNRNLFPDQLFGGVHQVERTTSGKIGGAVDKIPFVKSTVMLHDKLLNSKAVGQIVRNIESGASKAFAPLVKLSELSFKANAFVDDMFKGVAYVNRSLASERKNFITRMTTSFEDTIKILEKKTLSATQREKVLQGVHDWYYYGLNLTDFERRVVRRAIPFYSWMRWSSLYAYRITTEAPVRANIIKNLARDFYMFTGQNQLPDYLRGSVPVGTDENGTVYYLKTRGINPFSTITDFVSEGVLGAAFQGAAPAVKTVFEQATGRDVFLGKKFTEQGLTEAYNGDLYRFDPETGNVERVQGDVKPALLENLLRNYLPQYLLMESVLSGGNQRYTAAGLDEILKDLIRDPEERKAVVLDVITKQPREQTSLTRELGKALGINVQPVKLEQEKARREALNKATQALVNNEVPIFNENFKTMLKQRIVEELVSGTPPDEIKSNIKIWIGYNIDELKKLVTQ